MNPLSLVLLLSFWRETSTRFPLGMRGFSGFAMNVEGLVTLTPHAIVA